MRESVYLGILIIFVAWFCLPDRRDALVAVCRGSERIDQTVDARDATELDFCSTARDGQYSCPTQTITVGRTGYLSRVDVMVNRNVLADTGLTTPLHMEIRRLGSDGNPRSVTLTAASV